MSFPIPANNRYDDASIFSQVALLASVTVADRTLYNAQVVTHHRAPDLYQMIFGTTKRPEMNGAVA